MSAAVWFWLVYVVLVVCCLLLGWPFPNESRRSAGVVAIILVLVGLLAWATIGPPIR